MEVTIYDRMIMASAKTVANAETASIKDRHVAEAVGVTNASLLCKAIYPDSTKPLAAIASFPGRYIFNKEAMEAYAHHNFIFSGSASVKSSEGSDIEEFAEAISNEFSASGSYGFLPGASVSGSVTADFKCSSTSLKYVYFSQRRKAVTFGHIVLPSPLVKRDSLRALTNPDVLNQIDNEITTQDEEDEFVSDIGAVYFDTAQFGATLVMPSRSEGTTITSKKQLSAALSAEMNYLTASVSAENKFSVGTNQGEENCQLDG